MSVRFFWLAIFYLFFLNFAKAQEEKRISFSLFGGGSFLPAKERINNAGQNENLFGGFGFAPAGGLGLNYRFSQKLALSNNFFFFAAGKENFSFSSLGLMAGLRYYPLTDKHRLSPFVSGGLSMNLASIGREEYSEDFFPDTAGNTIGSGISVSKITYNYEKLDLKFIPMPGGFAGAGVQYRLSPKINIFLEYNYNYNLANLSSLMKEHYFANKANLNYHFAAAGLTFKLLKPRKQLLATLTKDAWDGDLTVSIKGTIIYKNPKKKMEKPLTVEMDDKRDTVMAYLPATPEGEFEYRNLRAEDYKFYLERKNRKVIRADIQILHDNRKVDIFEDFPELVMIDDFESSNLISRDNNFSVILREGFQHEVDVTVLANNIIGKLTPFSPDTLCRNMLVLLKNKQDVTLAVTKPDPNCNFHFDNVEPGQYNVVFVRDSIPGDVHFAYEFTETPPVIKRQYNTYEDKSYYTLYASAKESREYIPIDINKLLLDLDGMLALSDKDDKNNAPSGSDPGKKDSGLNNSNLISLNNNTADNKNNSNSNNSDNKVNNNSNSNTSVNNNNPSNNSSDNDEPVHNKKYPLNELKPGYSYSPEGEVKYPNGYGVQVGAFRSIENVKKCIARHKKAGNQPIFIQVLSEGENSYHVKLYRVVVGEYPDIETAEKEDKKLKDAGNETVIRKHRSGKSKVNN
jgi:cell division septation protein DedD